MYRKYNYIGVFLSILWIILFTSLDVAVISEYLAIISLFVASVTLWNRFKFLKSNQDDYLDPGFILLGFLYLYISFSGLIILLDLSEFTIINQNPFTLSELHIHLFRQTLTMVAISFFLNLTGESNKNNTRCVTKTLDHQSLSIAKSLLLIVLFVYLLSLFITLYFANPVSTYYEFYTRHDHLTGFSRNLVLIAKRTYWASLPFIVYYLIALYGSRSKAIFIIPILLGIVDVYISLGARINLFLIIFFMLLSYKHSGNRAPSLKKIMIFGGICASFMSLIEVNRIDAGVIGAESIVFYLPSELLALYYPSIHLYSEISSGTTFPWTFYFKDIFDLIPFGSTYQSNLMNWYWQTYHSSKDVAPYTMGIFAESALYGEYWLVVESFLLAYSANLFKRHVSSSNILWRPVFIYLITSCVLALKYNIFYYIQILLKNMLPIIALCFPVYLYLKRNQKKTVF